MPTEEAIATARTARVSMRHPHQHPQHHHWCSRLASTPPPALVRLHLERNHRQHLPRVLRQCPVGLGLASRRNHSQRVHRNRHALRLAPPLVRTLCLRHSSNQVVRQQPPPPSQQGLVSPQGHSPNVRHNQLVWVRSSSSSRGNHVPQRTLARTQCSCREQSSRSLLMVVVAAAVLVVLRGALPSFLLRHRIIYRHFLRLRVISTNLEWVLEP